MKPINYLHPTIQTGPEPLNEQFEEFLRSEGKVIEIELSSKPGIPNANGVVYSVESYKTAMDEYQKMIDRGAAFALLGFPRKQSFADIMKIDIKDLHSTICGIKDGKAIIHPLSTDSFDELTNAMKNEEMVLAMNAIAEIDKIDNGPLEVREGTLKIMSFSIVPRWQVHGKDRRII